MQQKLDLKSILLGVALGALLITLYGAGPNPGPGSGRFAIEANEGHVFVLDTVTGQVWEQFTPPTSGPTSSEFYHQKLPGSKPQ